MQPVRINFGLVLTVIAGLATITSGEIRYKIIDLGNFPGNDSSRAQGINAAGDVVGNASIDGSQHAFLYKNGVLKDLGTFGGQRSYAFDINDAGQIVGSTTTAAGVPYAYRYQNGAITNLGKFDAYRINNSGQVIGTFLFGTQPTRWHSVVYKDGQLIDLGTLGGNSAWVYGINDQGDIVGQSGTGTFNERDSEIYRGFVYRDGQMTPLGTLGGYDSLARDINNLGQISGWAKITTAFRPDFDTHPFLLNAVGDVMKDLDTVGCCTTDAVAINNLGQIVGYSDHLPGGDPHAFLYQNGQIGDLNFLIDPASGWLLRGATDINDSGQIVGYGRSPSGSEHAFLLTPVPEPAAALHLVVAAAGLLSRRRRMR